MSAVSIGYGDRGNNPSSSGSQGGVVRGFNESVHQDYDGIMTATYMAQGNYRKLVNFCRRQNEHPDMKYLLKTNWAIQRAEGNLGRATITYKGVGKNDEFCRYRVDNAVQSQPIETHPFFAKGNDIPAGKQTIDANAKSAYGYRFGGKIEDGEPDGSKQAIFVPTGGGEKFSHFPIDSHFDLPGITNYYDMGMTLNVIYVCHADDGPITPLRKDIKKGGAVFRVGFRMPPPDEICPNVSAIYQTAGGLELKHDWLVTGCNTEIIGSAMRQEIKYTLSGYKGWNRLLYSYDDPFKVSTRQRNVVVS